LGILNTQDSWEKVHDVERNALTSHLLLLFSELFFFERLKAGMRLPRDIGLDVSEERTRLDEQECSQVSHVSLHVYEMLFPVFFPKEARLSSIVRKEAGKR
jgi:hypothetical protein